MMASIQQPGQGADRKAPAPDQAGGTTQSDQSLSRSSADANDDGRFSVAEEVNLDQQGDKARQVGQIRQDADAAVDSADAMAKSMTHVKGRNPKDGRA